MKCLVLGAGGYIGRHLVSALQAAGHEIGSSKTIGAAQATRLDICDIDSLSKVDWAVDVVFLFAGVTGTAASFTNPERFVKSNEIGLLNVLDSIRKSKYRPRVVFPSSRLVYKGSGRPLRETAELEAKTVYAANKISCELCLRAYTNAFGVPHTIFRICVPYGNSQGGQYSFGTIGNFITQANEAGRIRLYGDGSLRRTFTHVDDICRFIVLGSTSGDIESDTFNIPGEDLSLLEAAELVSARLGATIEFASWPAFELTIESGSTVFDGGRLLSRLPTVIPRSMSEWAESIAPHRAG